MDQIGALFDLLIGRLTAAEVDVDRTVALGDVHIIGAGRADAGQFFDLAVILEDGQETGDAAFGQHLVDNIRLRNTPLGQSLDHVIDHHGNRAAGQRFVGNTVTQTGEGIDIAFGHKQIGIRLRFGLGNGFRFRLRLRLGRNHRFRLNRRRIHRLGDDYLGRGSNGFLLAAGREQGKRHTKCHQQGDRTRKLVQMHKFPSKIILRCRRRTAAAVIHDRAIRRGGGNCPPAVRTGGGSLPGPPH